MNPPSEKSVFLAALDLESADERAAFLAEVCAGNPVLRHDVEELLRAAELSDHPLDEIPSGVGAVFAQLEAVSVSERPGTVIGPYRLMEQIGEGGFGLVFVAEQQRPVRRKVALKLIKPGMDTREVIARFEAERQALALMDHPNIAHVLDAGETDTGRPFFVMELVRGVPITDFCDQNRLPTRDRLGLFHSVCQAVQHAHQKGVIHRDIKPSNVLVTLHDGTPVVKVIDFGVAKAIGQQLTEKTIYTRFAQVVGTPLYMSPEQAEMSGLDIDTRSDIYSLGVLLYELLTGSTPFDRRRLQQAAFDEVRRIIREEEPPRPSARLTTLGPTLATVSAQRSIEPRKLSALVRGDLDWIVMKALEKDRTRRYETAAGFAGDVRRFLNEEPVEARPPSTIYRLRKVARRNRVALTTVALVAAALILGTAVSTWEAVQASRARAEAVELRRKAEDFAERLKAANVLLAGARDHADQGRWATAYANYTRAAELQPDHYLVWSGRGSLYVRLGLWERAAADYARAMDLGAPANGPGFWGVPQLFLYVGEEQRYRQTCVQMLQQSETNPDPFASALAIRSCLVGPESVIEPAELSRKTERLVRDLLGGPSGPWSFGDRPPPPMPGRPPGPPRFMGWFTRGPSLHLEGFASYRAGEYARSVERLQESIAVGPAWPSRAVCYPVLAMAHHRAGNQEQAHAALASAEKTLDGWTRDMQSGPVGTLPLPWFEWVETLCLYREAHWQITGKPAPEDPRHRVLEQRALTALQSP